VKRLARRQVTRIEIAGGIAAGKTTLARQLAKSGLSAIHEDYRRNPFYAAFCEDPVNTAFETEIAFLLQHYHLQRSAITSGRPYCTDFSLVLDHAYACVTLSRADLKLFESMLGRTEAGLTARSLLIVLECDPEIELRRIKSRGRAAELSISVAYLRRINEALISRVQSASRVTKVLRINSGLIDYAHDRSAARDILAQVKTIIRPG
jgi:deoxyadenosine/deoxycytidine kinase